MGFRFVVLACIQVFYLQSAHAQPLGCACPNQVITETCIQNPVLVNQPSIIAQQSYLNPCGIDYINQYAVPTAPVTTIIQDGSIANNLVNALQILIVSNLLSNTLPCNEFVNLEVAQPALQIAQLGCGCGRGCGCGCGCGCGGGCGCRGLNYVL